MKGTQKKIARKRIARALNRGQCMKIGAICGVPITTYSGREDKIIFLGLLNENNVSDFQTILENDSFWHYPGKPGLEGSYIMERSIAEFADELAEMGGQWVD